MDGPFGLPVPHVLDQVLRTPDVSTVNLRTLGHYDGRVWWLPVVDALLLLGAAFLMAARSPARMRAWQHAVRTALALALTVLMICLVGRISAHYGLSLIGIGDAMRRPRGRALPQAETLERARPRRRVGPGDRVPRRPAGEGVHRKGEVVQDTVG